MVVGCNASSISFTFGNRAHNILAIYRPPSQLPTTFNETLAVYLNNLCNKYDVFTLLGDINLNIKTAVPLFDTSDYLNILSSFGLYSAINSCTRVVGSTESCLDHIFTNKREMATGHVLISSITDHYATALTLLHENVCQTHNKIKKYKKSLDEALLSNILASESWDSVLNQSDINVSTLNFINLLKSHVDYSTKTTIVSNKKTKIKPWITSCLLYSIRQRDKLYQKLKKQPNNQQLRIKFNNYRNHLKVQLSKTKNDYYKEKIRVNKKNPRKSWEIINEITDNNHMHREIKEIKDTKGQTITNSNLKKMAETFNQYFVEVGETLASQIPNSGRSQADFQTYTNPQSMFLAPAIEKEVDKYISELKSNSSPGPDGLSAHVLKQFRHYLKTPLLYIINLCLASALFPDCCKIATVIPLFKKGDRTNMENYRPISLTSNVGKLIEKAIKTRVVAFLEQSHFFADNQFGFRTGRSTQDAVTELTSLLYKDIDNDHHPLCIFIDLQKAFDTVPHDILLDKLEQAGLRGHIHVLLKSFLTNRRQRVRLKRQHTDYLSSTDIMTENTYYEETSDYTNVKIGIPQGTVTGPLLFLIFINNLLKLDVDSTILGFADDTVMHFKGVTWAETYNKAEKILYSVKNWLEVNQLTLNIAKTKYMTFSPTTTGQPSINLTLKLHTKNNCIRDICSCHTVTRTNSYCYLGVTIDTHLKWDEHIMLTSKRIRKTLYKFRRLRHALDIDTLRQVYHAIVQSVAQYSILAWGGAHDTHIKPIEIAMRTAIRVALCKPYRYPSELLYNEFNVSPLTLLYARQLLLYRYKRIATIQGRVELIQHGVNTRLGAGCNLKTLKPKTEHYKHSHIYTSISLYNFLPEHIKTIVIYSQFVRSITEILHKDYNTIFRIIKA